VTTVIFENNFVRAQVSFILDHDAPNDEETAIVFSSHHDLEYGSRFGPFGISCGVNPRSRQKYHNFLAINARWGVLKQPIVSVTFL
jgi:hypothetical protein